MMKKIKLFKKYNIDINWDDIYYGYHRGFFSIEELNSYINTYLTLEKSEGNQDIISLAIELSSKNTEKINEVLKRVGDKDSPSAQAKWLLCFLEDVIHSNLTPKEMIDEIHSIYMRFGSPEDMWDLIYFHPSNSSGNSDKLLSKVKSFILLLKSKIKIG